MKNSTLVALLPVCTYTGDELQRQVDVVRLLLSFHVNPTCGDERRLTPLHYASFFGPKEVVQLLIDALSSHPFLPLSSSSTGNSPSSLAPLHSQPPTSSPISPISLSSAINSKDVPGHTPLTYAAAANHLSIASLLLSHGATATNSCFCRHSTLYFPIKHRYVDMVLLLLEHGPYLQKDMHSVIQWETSTS